MKITFHKNNKSSYRVDISVCKLSVFENTHTVSAISFLPANQNSWVLPQSDLKILKLVSSNSLIRFDHTKAFVNDKATIYLLIVAYVELAKKHQLTIDEVIFDDADMLDESILSDLLGQQVA